MATEPVNATRRTSVCVTRGVPASGPVPVTTLSTPSGRPASVASCASRNVDTEVNSDGFTTTALPTASAGATARLVWLSGRFHGVITPTTPKGSSRV